MAIIKLENFTGEVPRLPAHLLPDNAAAEAVNCDFAHGELRALRGPGVVKYTPQAVRSLFSDDGLRFFTWSKPTWARLGPTIDDVFGRVYFANADGFFVTQTQFMKPGTAGPNSPASAWRVGLPRPEAPRVEAVELNLGALEITLWREAGGAVAEQVQIVECEEILHGREYLLSYGQAGGGGSGGGAAAQAGESLERVFIDGVRGYDSNPIAEWDMDNYGEYVPVGVECRLVSIHEGVAIIPLNGKKLDALSKQGTRFLFFSTQDGRTGYQVPYIIKNGHEYTGETFYALLKNGQLPGTHAGSVSVLDGGTWLSTASKLTARVACDGWLAFSAGSVQEGEASPGKAKVYLEPAGEGRVRLKIDYGEKTSVAYCVTFVNEWNEESQASEPVLVELDALQVAQVHVDYSGFANGVPLRGMHVYRTYGVSDRYVLVNRVPVGAPYVLLDESTEPETSTVLESAEWEAPHANLHLVTYVGNGFLAGAVGKDLYFSEPYHPHAWPYAMTFPHAIIGLESVEGGVLVTTVGKPYLVNGAHPEQMSQQLVEADQAGVSDRSLARVGGNAVFASQDGLVLVSGGQATLESSQQLFTRQDWRGRYQPVLRQMVLGAHDGALVGVVDPGGSVSQTGPDGFILRLDEGGGSYTRLRLASAPLGMGIVPEVDGLYLGFANGFAEFGAGDALEFVWRSRDFVFPSPVSFAAVIVECSPGVTVTVYRDQSAVFNRTVGAGESRFRLPVLAPHKTWAVQFRGRGCLRKFEMGASFRELANG